jgi:alkylation response protein AidB-like acyl-CoA dehydrogenase
VKLPASRPAAERVAVQIAVAEMDMELMAAKAMQQAHLLEIDSIFATLTPRTAPLDVMRKFAGASRASKTFAERAAINVVNRAMSLAGGGSYVSGSDFSRWYRDVRALPFMAPAATENMQFIGKVALGLEPTIDY